MEDIIGQSFGCLTVVEKSNRKRNETTLYRCKCKYCNKDVYRFKGKLLKGEYKECRCKLAIEPIIGKRYNHWTILSFSHRNGIYFHFHCLCDCGEEKVIEKSSFVRGNSKTCGCSVKRTGKDNKLWKGYGEISGSVWCDIKKCAERRKIKFDISIEEAWELFLQQNRRCALTGRILIFNQRDDESNQRTASLDRIKSSDGYVKGNLQWVHKDINNIKWTLEQDKFIDLCKQVYLYSIKGDNNNAT